MRAFLAIRDHEAVFEENEDSRTKVIAFHTIAKHGFGIITAVKNNDAVLIDIQILKIFKMLQSDRTF